MFQKTRGAISTGMVSIPGDKIINSPGSNKKI